MDIRYVGKNISVSEGMKKHLFQKISKLDKYAPRIVESHVVLAKQKYLFAAEITLLAKNFRAYGEGESKENIFTAIDQAAQRIEKQLKKFREKVKSHHKGGEIDIEKSSPRKTKASKEKEAFSSEDRPQVVPSRAFAVKPMSTEEASMQLQLSPQPFLVFQNASTQKVNVIFKKEDGNHGLIEPGF